CAAPTAPGTTRRTAPPAAARAATAVAAGPARGRPRRECRRVSSSRGTVEDALDDPGLGPPAPPQPARVEEPVHQVAHLGREAPARPSHRAPPPPVADDAKCEPRSQNLGLEE